MKEKNFPRQPGMIRIFSEGVERRNWPYEPVEIKVSSEVARQMGHRYFKQQNNGGFKQVIY